MPNDAQTTPTPVNRAPNVPSRAAINASLENLTSKLDSLLATYGVPGKKRANSAVTVTAPSTAANEVSVVTVATTAAPSVPDLGNSTTQPEVVVTETKPVAEPEPYEAPATESVPVAKTAEAPVPVLVPAPIEEPETEEQEIEDSEPATTPAVLESSAEPNSNNETDATSNVATTTVAEETDNLLNFHLDEIRTSRVMIVDDEEVNVLTVKHHLSKEGFFNFVTTTDPRNVVAMFRSEKPDVVLLDIKMPHVSGMDILRARQLDKSLHHIPIIVLTATTDPAIKREALELGAYDFLTKPVDPSDLMPRVRNALVVKHHFDQVANEAVRLEALVHRRTAELLESRQQLILSLARAAEHRDNETGNHIIRVGRYAAIIARELGWPQEKVEMIEQAAQLHDVGKIGIPDAILFKPGKLDPQEYDIIKRHCAIGRGIVDPLSGRDFEMFRNHADIGSTILNVRGSPMLAMASRIAQTHHEHWNGCGYPLGLRGEDIPIEGRITAVADVFDALSSRRPYKEPFPREKCFTILTEGRGKQFDPAVLDAFFRRSQEIVEVQLRLMDPAPPIPRPDIRS